MAHNEAGVRARWARHDGVTIGLVASPRAGQPLSPPLRQPGEPSGRRRNTSRLEIVLPHTPYGPPGGAKGSRIPAVASSVSHHLRLPVLSVRARQPPMERAAVEEATVSEDCNAKVIDHDVGPTRQCLDVASHLDAGEGLDQQLSKSAFGRRPGRSNVRHDLASKRWSEGVGHRNATLRRPARPDRPSRTASSGAVGVGCLQGIRELRQSRACGFGRGVCRR